MNNNGTWDQETAARFGRRVRELTDELREAERVEEETRAVYNTARRRRKECQDSLREYVENTTSAAPLFDGVTAAEPERRPAPPATRWDRVRLCHCGLSPKVEDKLKALDLDDLGDLERWAQAQGRKVADALHTYGLSTREAKEVNRVLGRKKKELPVSETPPPASVPLGKRGAIRIPANQVEDRGCRTVPPDPALFPDDLPNPDPGPAHARCCRCDQLFGGVVLFDAPKDDRALAQLDDEDLIRVSQLSAEVQSRHEQSEHVCVGCLRALAAEGVDVCPEEEKPKKRRRAKR